MDTTPHIRLACLTTRCSSLTRTAKRSTSTTRRSQVGPWTRWRDRPGQLGSAAAHAKASETLRKWVWVGATMPGRMLVEAMRAEGASEAITWYAASSSVPSTPASLARDSYELSRPSAGVTDRCGGRGGRPSMVTQAPTRRVTLCTSAPRCHRHGSCTVTSVVEIDRIKLCMDRP